MGVYKRLLANARHVYRVGVRFDGETYFETVGTDRRVAERLDKQRKREVAARTYVPGTKSSGSTTILDYAAEWLEERGNRTKKDDAQRMRDHILPRVGANKLQDLSRLDAKDLIKALVADPAISIKTAKNAFGVFRTMMQEAFDSELIPRDPCGRLPRGTWPSDAEAGDKGKKPRGIYSRDEVVRLTTSDEIPPGVRVLNSIFFYTGTREGEGCGLEWRQWTRDSLPLGALAIDWQYDHQPLKQDEQPRRVPVHPALAKTLDWWWREGFALTYGRAPTLRDHIVPRLAAGRWNKSLTLGEASECHTKSSAYKAFTRACARLGIECRTLHSTRHTMITASRRGDKTGALLAPLERITHNAKGEVIDCYTHWEWEPLCQAILAIAYAPGSEPKSPVPAQLPEATSAASGETEFATIFATSAAAREIIDENGGGAGNRTRQTDHESSRKTTFLRVEGPPDQPPNPPQIAQVDARFAARQTSVEDAARNYLVVGSNGDPCADLALQLAASVMSERRVQLAMAVLGSGPHMHARATDLAALVLGESVAPVSLDLVRAKREGK